MSVEGDNNHGYDLICDVCGGHENEPFFSFHEAVDYKKANGWRSRKDKDGYWEDICPECLEEEGEGDK